MEGRKKINEVLSNIKESSNKDILYCLEFLNQDFEQTKKSIIKLTEHLDNTEMIYNKLIKEFELRTNGR